MNDATARLPWRRGGRQTSYIYDADGKVVAESAGLKFVALIVHRVNAHDALVAALERILEEHGALCVYPMMPAFDQARAALEAVGSRNGEAKP